MLDGTVKWFDQNRGFGFIEQASGPDIFIHFSEINTTQATGFKTLLEGDRVTFEIKQGKKGPNATNVSLIVS